MINICIMGMASIAVKRMIPAIKKDNGFSLKYIAVASAKEHGNSEDISEKVKKVSEYSKTVGAECIVGYEELCKHSDIDVVYIPLPPSLHFRWAKLALENGKDVIVEKPLTTSLQDTRELIRLAKEKGRTIIENYGFTDHNQVTRIKKLLSDGSIGTPALVRASFGFPHRDANDFRYSKELGGGALLDCGGYTLKAASLFLGDSVKLLGSSLKITEGHEVDIYGNALLVNEDGLNASVSFGMDNSYKCELEIWGSKGTITAGRFFTAPDGFDAPILLKPNNGEAIQYFESDDQFLRVLEQYRKCLADSDANLKNQEALLLQASLVEECFKNVY